jgi:Polyketide synthase modules and related proteins
MRPLSLPSGSSNNRAIPSDSLEPIAIVGLATRFPQQATTTESLWELLLLARSTWSSIPKERFNSGAFYHPDPEHGGTVNNIRALPTRIIMENTRLTYIYL